MSTNAKAFRLHKLSTHPKINRDAKLEIMDNSKYFADVPSTSWAADAVAFASAHELFKGTGTTQFSPDQPMSRGMLATVLHNLESNPYQPISGIFADVNNSAWYAEGVAWAASNGIVGGYGNGQFAPNDNITREQLAVMLWAVRWKPHRNEQGTVFCRRIPGQRLGVGGPVLGNRERHHQRQG